MKKLSKLKLNVLNEQSLEERQMNALRGGVNCGCSCYYENNSGSSSNNNMNANYRLGTKSINGCNQYVNMFDGAFYGYCPSCNESNQGYIG
jgi:natural product precursor